MIKDFEGNAERFTYEDMARRLYEEYESGREPVYC